ncbi:efflux RND transporter periplasmic adaptor subunit [Aquisphaera giovannonii]|uniref:efflux RND transporter periplasmic adaptor subunit n=1 Tax=Aquisphaera giovannonii TaxID=406548 RepID=UPI001FECAFA3|nr:efflux RND transporter periplasmic adaptor subunit [Aquisphaera giovannonii]
MRPKAGGVERQTVQPGSVHAFETVDVYAMVSGYLKRQPVDIGTRVRKGDLLAEIDVPREAEAVAESAALLAQARARVTQAAAQLATAEADRTAAEAVAAQAEADIDRCVADRSLEEKAFDRIGHLVQRSAVEPRLLDEERHRLELTVAAEKAARISLRAARAKLQAATARIGQARADVAEAEAAVGVAEARVARAKVDLAYARIVAPFDGVITSRNYHPGAFISSAAAGGREPLLTVARTDLMRVVVRVPDRDVALAQPGDRATLVVDALGNRRFEGAVSRVGESEDHASRTMRVEIDLPNPDGALREGMYGRAVIALEPSTGRLSLPTACVLDRTGKGRGVVQLVREGKVERASVELGVDDGKLVEVVSGVGAGDQVVLRSGASLEPGTPVATRPAG